MTAVTAPAAGRFPVRRDVDADFTPAQVLASLPQASAGRRPVPPAGVAESAQAARLWIPAQAAGRAPLSGPPIPLAQDRGASPARAGDEDLLHRFETARLWRPPVEEHTRTLTPGVARAWLELADHWAGVADMSGDLRFLNAACKLLGTVWMRHCVDHWDAPDLTAHIAATAALLQDACAELSARLSDRELPPGSASAADDHEPPRRPVTTGRLTTVILAGLGSSSPAAFLAKARTAGADASGVCWYGEPGAKAEPSGYSSAWYPPEPGHCSPPARELSVRQAHATDWDEVARALRRWQPDLLVLLGMPIIPASILMIPALATINTHNGALPAYRGMDAVGWALLNNDPIVCTVHQVTAGVDSGPVLLAQAVPFSPRPTLRQRVKSTQLALLAAVTAHAAAALRLPDGVSQPPRLARQFYRLHPHLKRMLDTSPYGTGGSQ